MHSTIGARDSAYLEESRSKARFWFGLMFNIVVEAVCSTIDGVSDEEIVNADGEGDE